MELLGSSFVSTTADRPSLPEGGTGACRIIVWPQGDHEANALGTWVEMPAAGYPTTTVPERGGRLASSGW
jgi:hypothetical protein